MFGKIQLTRTHTIAVRVADALNRLLKDDSPYKPIVSGFKLKVYMMRLLDGVEAPRVEMYPAGWPKGWLVAFSLVHKDNGLIVIKQAYVGLMIAPSIYLFEHFAGVDRTGDPDFDPEQPLLVLSKTRKRSGPVHI